MTEKTGFDISQTGEFIRENKGRGEEVTFQCSFDAPVTVVVDVSNDGERWYEQVVTYASALRIRDAWVQVSRHVRARIVHTQAEAGDEGDAVLEVANE